MHSLPDKTIVRRQPLTAFAASSSSADQAVHPVLQRVLVNRNIDSLGALCGSLADLLQPAQLKGIDAAAERLIDAVVRSEKVLVIGDYDVDGATATAVAVLGLRQFGLHRIGYLVPNRFEFGYGLSTEIAQVALTADRAPPDLVITVDNGINSRDGVALLRRHKVDVIVTDHHLAGAQLPPASAIVNPNQPGCGFASKALAGVGVMFYLLLHLRARLRQQDWFARHGLAEPRLADLLDLVALGTVADVVPLDANNRILVSQGLARIRQGYCRPGVRAILQQAGKTLTRVTTADLGFAVSPRINAAGRLEDIATGIECLLADDADRAMQLAECLHRINLQRREVERGMKAEALTMVAQLQLEAARPVHCHCLFQPGWHQGITGLIAGRMRDLTGLPVLAFAAIKDDLVVGSARSVAGLHIRDLLERIDALHPGLIRQFGGHAVAAGLTLERHNLSAFADHLEAAVAVAMSNQPPRHEIFTDGALLPQWYSIECAQLLSDAAPWGQQLPAPLFDDVFEVVDSRIVGQQHLKLQLRHSLLQRPLPAIAFHCHEPDKAVLVRGRVRVVFRLDVNIFRGVSELQLLVEHLQPELPPG